MSTNITGLAGEIIAFTYPSLIKVSDNGNLPTTDGGNRNANAVFTNPNRSELPTALSRLSDGSGVVSSLAIGPQNGGAKVFGPLIVQGDSGTVTTKTLEIKNGGLCLLCEICAAGTGTHTINGTSQLGTLKVTDGSTLCGAILGCNNLTICCTSTLHGCTTTCGGLKVAAGNLTVCGTIEASDDITAFKTSDKRLKNNIIKIQNSNNVINSLNGYKYEWGEKATQTGEDVGVIAQEVKEFIPSAVRENGKGYLSVDYVKLIPYLIEEVKSLNNRIKILEEK
tara:strand:- start:3397 stop:4239 length:843 start_codon:yes stop_codon:yes gene_type:complete